MSFPQYGEPCLPSYTTFFGTKTPEPTHTGCPGGSGTPGLIGGTSCPCECHRRVPNRPAPHYSPVPSASSAFPPVADVVTQHEVDCGYCARCGSTGPFDARDDAAMQAMDGDHQEFPHDE